MKQFILGKDDSGYERIAVDAITRLYSYRKGKGWQHFAMMGDKQYEIDAKDYDLLISGPVTVVAAPAGFTIITAHRAHDESGKEIGLWFSTMPVAAWEITPYNTARPITLTDLTDTYSEALLCPDGVVIDPFEPGITWPSVEAYKKSAEEQWTAEKAERAAA